MALTKCCLVLGVMIHRCFVEWLHPDFSLFMDVLSSLLFLWDMHLKLHNNSLTSYYHVINLLVYSWNAKQLQYRYTHYYTQRFNAYYIIKSLSEVLYKIDVC